MMTPWRFAQCVGSSRSLNMNKLAVDARNLMVRNLGVVDFVITFVG